MCLFLLFGGSAYAAAKITGKQIKDSSITGKDVKNKSLTKRDFRGSIRGPQGKTGPAGPSVTGQITLVKSAPVAYGSEFVQSAVATCPSGTRVLSGGGVTVSDEQLAATEPLNDRSGWYVIGVDLTDNGGEYVQADALCAPAGQAVAAGNRKRALAAVAHKVAKIKAERH